MKAHRLGFLGFLFSPILSMVSWRDSHNSIFFYDDSSLGPGNLIYHSNLASLVENENYSRLKDAPFLHTVIISAINQTIPDCMYEHIRKCKEVQINGGYNSYVLEFIKKWPSMEILTMEERSDDTENLHLGFIEALKETMMKKSLNIKIKALSISMLECDDEIMKAFSDIILDRGLKIEGVSFGFNGCSDFALSNIFETMKSPFLNSFILDLDGTGEKSLSHYLKETLTKSPITFFKVGSQDFVLSEEDLRELGPIFSSSQLTTVNFRIRKIFGFTGKYDEEFKQTVDAFSNSMKDSHILDFEIIARENGMHHHSFTILVKEERTEKEIQGKIFSDLKDSYLLEDFDSVIKLAYHTEKSFTEKRIVGWTADAVAIAKKHFVLKALRNDPFVDLSNINLTDDELLDFIIGYRSSVKDRRHQRPIIEALDLSKNGLTLRGKSITALMKRFRIKVLDLSRNRLGDDGLKLLSHFIPGSHLISLDLSHNGVTDEGVSELARNLNLGNRLRNLSLSYNNLGDAGLGSLAKALEKAPLERLELDGCIRISDSGVQELAIQIPKSQLTKLDIVTKRFKNETLDRLISSFGKSLMTDFKLQLMEHYHLDEGFLYSLRQVCKENGEKYEGFKAIRDAFGGRSFGKVIQLAEKDGARVVGWVEEIVKASRQYLEISESSSNRLRNRRITFNQVDKGTIDPIIIEENFVIPPSSHE